MADFNAARSRTIPPLPWPTFAPPISASKIARFGRAILAIDDGRVLIPASAPWLERFLYEVASFPNITDKDQVDSMSQLVGNIDVGIRKARRFAGR